MELTKETHPVATSPHSQALSQLIEFSWKATRGLVQETESHVNQLVDRLVDAGKITSEDRTKLSALVSQRMLDSRKVFLNSIDTHVRTAVDKIIALSATEVAQLEKAIAALEQKIAQR